MGWCNFVSKGVHVYFMKTHILSLLSKCSAMWLAKISFMATVLQLMVCFGGIYCSLVDTESLYSTLLTGYNKRLLPRLNQSEATNVTLSAAIISLNEFEELTGRLAVTLGFIMHWTEQRFTWDPANYSGKKDILFDIKDIWRPRLSITESVNYVQTVGTDSDLVRVYNNGSVLWSTGNVVQVFCSVDVTFFPFDSQTCRITYVSLTYTISEVIIAARGELSTDIFRANSMWRLKSSNVYANELPNFSTAATIMLNLERRSEFFVVYIIVPLLFLGALNICVFFMSSDSGERHSVAITALLAFVVYMSEVNSVIPQSSEPIAYIYYYLLFLIIYSSTIMILCTCSMRLYEKTGTVPDNIKCFLNIARWGRCSKHIFCRKTKVKSVSHVSLDRPDSPADSIMKKEDTLDKTESETSDSRRQELTWRDVGKIFDKACVVVLMLAFIIFSTTTVSKLYFNLVFFSV